MIKNQLFVGDTTGNLAVEKNIIKIGKDPITNIEQINNELILLESEKNFHICRL